ncbi:MAG: LL-diaminopimelate aminotransferase [Cellulomonadaceae bacterium]|jgi:LL-diaminopimelate aminotransferase|nr:LL-diaminopimelate aminotransferase [Cellulomonadaceae bacterium]
MVKRNSDLANLKAGYLFPEIAKRRREFAQAHPEANIISLGIGNTTEPLTPHVTAGLVAEAQRLGTEAGYSGYQDEGLPTLRERISEVFYDGKFDISEIFISDGAKCDIGRLQVMFGSENPVTVQDPSYPVYVDGSVLIGAAGGWNGNGYNGITYLPCTAENGYFPDLSKVPAGSLVYFCSPNNPTGAVATREQLENLVAMAIEKGCIIIYDAAYSEFIRDPELPKTIYDIPDAVTCAIELNSFSKPIGFTGVRLGWSVVPKELQYQSGESVNADWHRISGTIFNGASNVAQAGGLASLDPDGLREMRAGTDFYLENAKLIKRAITDLGITSVGGENSPYIWAHFPGRDSWQVFSDILEKCHVVTTPGAGFGPAGEGYIRFSAFGHRADIVEACERLKALQV